MNNNSEFNSTNFYAKNKKKDEVNNTIITQAKLPLLTTIYISSLTIVGLFILFRFVQKHP